MKKILFEIAMFVTVLTANAQFESTHLNIPQAIGQPVCVQVETYQQGYCYVNEQDTTITRWIDDTGFLAQITPKHFTSKYALYTPGQLIYRSGQLKNTALTTGIVCGLAGGALIGFSFMMNDPLVLSITGGAVAFVGGVASICLLYTSNKLLKEAGLKMERIQFSANGLTVKF